MIGEVAAPFHDATVDCVKYEDIEAWLRQHGPAHFSPLIGRPWLQAFARETISPIFLQFTDGEHIVGVAGGLQVASSQRPFFRSITKRLFFYSGPIVILQNELLIAKCISSLRRFATRCGYSACTVKWYDYPFSINVEEIGFDDSSSIEYIIDLQLREDELFHRMHSTNRRRIRKSSEHFFQFREVSKNRLYELLECASDTALRKSEQQIDYNFYYIDFTNQNVLERLFDNGSCRLFNLYNSGKLLSSIFIAVGFKQAFVVFTGSTQDGYRAGSSLIMYWELMKTLKKEGYLLLNLGGVARDPKLKPQNLARFKESLGALKTNCTGAISRNLQQGSWRDWAWRLHQRFA